MTICFCFPARHIGPPRNVLRRPIFAELLNFAGHTIGDLFLEGVERGLPDQFGREEPKGLGAGSRPTDRETDFPEAMHRWRLSNVSTPSPVSAEIMASCGRARAKSSRAAGASVSVLFSTVRMGANGRYLEPRRLDERYYLTLGHVDQIDDDVGILKRIEGRATHGPLKRIPWAQ